MSKAPKDPQPDNQEQRENDGKTADHPQVAAFQQFLCGGITALLGLVTLYFQALDPLPSTWQTTALDLLTLGWTGLGLGLMLTGYLRFLVSRLRGFHRSGR